MASDACGTNYGYYRHRRRHETPCLSCCEAHAQYQQDKRLAAQRRAVLAEAISRRPRLPAVEWDGQPSYEVRRETLTEWDGTP